MPKLNNRGFLLVPFLVGLLVLGISGYFGYTYLFNSNVNEDDDVLALTNPKIVPCQKADQVTREFWSPNFMEKQGWSVQNGQPCFYNRVEIRNNRQALRDLVAIRNSYYTTTKTTSPSGTTPGDVFNKPRRAGNVIITPTFPTGLPELFKKFTYTSLPPQNRNIFIGYDAPSPKEGSNVKASSLKGCLDFFPDTTGGQKINYLTFPNPLTGAISRYAVFNDVETYLPNREVFYSRVIWQVSGPMLNVEGGVRYCQNVIVVPDKVENFKFYTNMKGYVAPTAPAKAPNRGGGNTGGGSNTGGGNNSGGGSNTGGGNNSGGGSNTGGGNNSGGSTTTASGVIITPTKPSATTPSKIVTPTQPAKFVGCTKTTTSGQYFSNCYANKAQNSTNCDVMSYQINTARCTFAAEVGEYCSSIMGGCNTRYNIQVVSRRSTNQPF